MNKHKYLYTLSLICFAMLLLHCGGDDGFPGPPQPTDPEVTAIHLELSSAYSVTSGARPVELTVTGDLDNGNSRSISDYVILVDEQDQGRLLNFSSDEAGVYRLKASYKGLESQEVTVEVRPALELEMKTFQVIFHIVHDGEAVGEGYNISADRIDYQMSLLEKTFEQSNAVTANSAMPQIDFQLATIDPQGNHLTEPGINRFQRPSTNASVLFEEWMWEHYWDPDYYINVWVGDTKNGYSWGIYPNFDCADDINLEGLGCAEENFPGRLEGIALELDNLYNENWVFPHEMGHVFGLFHIFEGGECSRDVDFCPDTQQYSRTDYENGADHATRIACDGTEFVSYNVMDYWRQPNGTRDLSYDQVKRIRTVVDHGKWRAGKLLSDGQPRDMSSRGG